MDPHGAQLGDTVVPNRETFRDDRAVNGCLSLWLGQECHTEGPKVGPEQEVERVEGVRPSCGMLHILFPTKQPFRGELYSTVIGKSLRVDLGIVLKGEQ